MKGRAKQLVENAIARERERPEEGRDSGCSSTPEKLADDLLRGAAAIAEFVYGDSAARRKIFHLAETSRIPVFRLGSMLCARRSVLLKWIAEQEERGWGRAR